MPQKISLICVFLPLVCVHTTLVIGIAMGNLEPCVPYWSECHSISATGRQYPEFFVFKALMIPTAVFMAGYWLLLHKWLAHIDQSVKRTGITAQGLVACIALVVYTVTLGAVGEPYALARRMGIVFFFVFSSFAHLLLLAKLSRIDRSVLGIAGLYQIMFKLCLVLVISSIVSAIFGYLIPDIWDSWENAFEWTYSLFMIALYFIVGKMWQRTGFSWSTSTQNPSSSD